MKKLIAVMAFAGVLSVPSVLLADANWYGSLRGGVEFGGGDDARFKDGGSRWGIKGSNEVSEGLSAVYRFEAKIDSASATQVGGDRLSYVGLSGGFGTLSMGRVGSAGGNSTGGMLDNSFHYGNSYTGFRTGNAVSYSHSVGGVSVQLDAIMKPMDAKTGATADGAIDETQLGLSMNLGDFGKLAVSHVNVEDTMMDGMVDLVIRGADHNYQTIKDGKATATTGLIWETKDKKAKFDPDTAKSLMLTHTTGADDTPVEIMTVYHTGADNSFTSGTAVVKDGKLTASTSDCSSDTPCSGESTVWVSSDYVVPNGEDDGVKTYTVVAASEVNTTGTATVTDVTPGEKKSTIAAEFGLGGITAFVGYSQVESNMKGAKKDKITHYGIRGGLGESGVNFLVQLRSEDLQGSKPMDADRDPYVVNMSKSLGDGATAYIEHGTGDAKGEKANTRIGMIVNF